MKQTELNRAVARATGETVERIQRIGFNLEAPPRVYVPRSGRRRRRRRAAAAR